MAEQLHGPAFPAIWGRFVESMHIELLPPDAQQLLNSNTTPRQHLVLGYWHDVLTRPPEDIEAMAEAGLATIRTERLPYMFIAGDEVTRHTGTGCTSGSHTRRSRSSRAAATFRSWLIRMSSRSASPKRHSGPSDVDSK